VKEKLGKEEKVLRVKLMQKGPRTKRACKEISAW
jgi:hypothetical protein